MVLRKIAAALLIASAFVAPAAAQQALGVGQSQSAGVSSGPILATCSGTPCVANASHAGGTSVGGLYTMALGRAPGGSGLGQQVQYISTGGSTGSYVLRGWTKLPTGTCTDNAAYVGNANDDAFLIPGTPTTITPAAPGVTTGDARTYATWAPQNGFSFENHDANPIVTPNVYWCLVTVSTDTADQNTSPKLVGTAIQD